MAVITLNEIRYKKLLSRAMPKVIETGKEDERMAAELEQLDRLGRALTPEEQQLAALMTLLIQQFEARAKTCRGFSRSRGSVYIDLS